MSAATVGNAVVPLLTANVRQDFGSVPVDGSHDTEGAVGFQHQSANIFDGGNALAAKNRMDFVTRDPLRQ